MKKREEQEIVRSMTDPSTLKRWEIAGIIATLVIVLTILLYALTDFYLKRNKLEEAKYYAEQLAAKHPDQPIVYELLSHIKRSL